MADPPTNTTCACGRPFACGAASGRCWCFDRPNVLPLPGQGGGCLCPQCLNERIAALPAPTPPVGTPPAEPTTV